MKMITMFALMLAVSNAALAQGYALDNAKQSLCRSYGRVAVTYLQDREAGKPKDEVATTLGGDPVLIFALDYVYGGFPTIRDVYMAAWAKCMDVNE